MQVKYRKIKNNMNKKGDGVFGLSFSTIFSIILIVFFIMVAFLAINFFLDWQKKMQIGVFFEDLQADIKNALNSNSAAETKSYTIPSGIKDVCFIDLNSPKKNANDIEEGIYDYVFMKEGVQNFKENVYLYAPDKDYGISWKEIKYINTTEKNPTCVPVKNNIVSINIERKYEGYSVYVSAK